MYDQVRRFGADTEQITPHKHLYIFTGFLDSGRTLPYFLLRIASVSASESLTLALYLLTIFLNAALLFILEPMIARMVLPFAGGSPAVWNTSVLFFQICLLLGYLYAHF